ncbi:AsmA family protein [Psychrobium sp. nBUS_13]|uniref:AsmA family protein n=1 Tax=Psychrobium sp. nBUS_13 TaxID=3395319 RepID=UPI003EBAF8EE
MKRFLKIVLAIVLLIIVAIIGLVLLVDPNDYKAEIEQQAEKSLNRKLAINGELGWVIFPKLAIGTGQIELKNAPGFSKENLAKIDKLAVSVDVMPLLSGEVKLGQVSLDGLSFNLETNAQGVSNLDGMGNNNASSTPKQVTPTESRQSELPKLALAGIDITNTLITVIDKKLGTETDLSIKLIELGAFELGKDTTLDVILNVVTNEFVGDLNLKAMMNVNKDISTIDLKTMSVNGSLKGENVPAGEMNIALKTSTNVQLSPMIATIEQLSLDVNGMTIDGTASVALLDKTTVRFDLKGNEWDLNPLIPAPASDQEASTVPTEPTPEVEPDLSVLNTLDVDGKLVIAGFKAKGINIGQTKLAVNVKDGSAKLAPLSVDLYEGNMTLNASVSHDKGRNSYSINTQLNGVQILPLLKDAADVDLLAGTTQFNLVAKGQGLTVSKIKQVLDGQGNFAVRDGALYGINLAQKLRSVKAALGSSASEEEKKTDFTALTGEFTMSKGLVNNTSLLMEAPFLRLNGQGTANILQELVDYHLKVTLVGTSKGQNGGSDLAGLAIPLKVTGSFTEPKFGLDTGGALKAKLDQEKAALTSKLNDAKVKAKLAADKAKEEAKQKAKDKLKDKLKGLF